MGTAESSNQPEKSPVEDIVPSPSIILCAEHTGVTSTPLILCRTLGVKKMKIVGGMRGTLTSHCIRRTSGSKMNSATMAQRAARPIRNSTSKLSRWQTELVDGNRIRSQPIHRVGYRR